MEERFMLDAHGAQFFSRWWPLEHPTGVVIISHGASDHTGRYGRFAASLNDVGFAVVAIGHVGLGRHDDHGSARGGGCLAEENPHQGTIDYFEECP